MGKKKSQQHVQQSMGSLISRSALAQMGPQIESLVRSMVNQLGSQLATQQASTLETLFSRVIVLERIAMQKFGYTIEELADLVADFEDEREGLKKVEGPSEFMDVVRFEIQTKTKDQTEYQGSSRLKVSDLGKGQTLGDELENSVIGMSAGDTKEVSFGTDMTAKISVNRVSRKSNEGTQNESKS